MSHPDSVNLLIFKKKYAILTLTIESITDADVLYINQLEIATETHAPASEVVAYGSIFNKLIKSEEHIVYMKLNGTVTPIKIIYSDYKNADGLTYQDVVCINLLDNTYIDYADICTK